MTAVAGFIFDSGILMCADTKHTYSGQMKLESTKIFSSSHPNGINSAFGIVGSVDYARMAMQECEAALSGLSRRNTKAKIRAVITRVLRDICREPHEAFELLLAIYSPTNGLAMFKTRDGAVCELRGYECLGSGSYLGHYLVRDQYQRLGRTNASLDGILFLSVSALTNIKNYDDGCGGRSEFVVLRRDGTMSDVVSFDISPPSRAAMEKDSPEFRKLLKDLSATRSLKPSATLP